MVSIMVSIQTINAADVTLAGKWEFQLDPNGVGISEKWYNVPLSDSIRLPGTTDEAGKGYAVDHHSMSYPKDMPYSVFPSITKPKKVDRCGFLTREHYYLGKAWYRRAFSVSSKQSTKYLQLKLERVIWRSQVWVDGKFVGTHDSLAIPHIYDLGRLVAGHHTLTICVDNSMIHNTGTIGHSYGPETQSRWNGIVGDISIITHDPIWINDIQVYPHVEERQVNLKINIRNPGQQ